MFAKDFPGVIGESGKRDRKQIIGIGGAPVLLQETLPGSRDYHGLLGWTLLQQASRVTVDFRAMKLTLE